MQCQPSAQGQLVLHVNTFTKKESYAYMLERYGPDTSKWPYIPGGRTLAQPGNPAASPEPAARKVPAACPALSPALACPSRLAAFHLPCVQWHGRAPRGGRFREPTPSRARRRFRAEFARRAARAPARRRDHDRIRPCAPGRPARRRRALCGHHRGADHDPEAACIRLASAECNEGNYNTLTCGYVVSEGGLHPKAHGCCRLSFRWSTIVRGRCRRR
jgi:hypothetical protein